MSALRIMGAQGAYRFGISCKSEYRNYYTHNLGAYSFVYIAVNAATDV